MGLRLAAALHKTDVSLCMFIAVWLFERPHATTRPPGKLLESVLVCARWLHYLIAPCFMSARLSTRKTPLLFFSFLPGRPAFRANPLQERIFSQTPGRHPTRPTSYQRNRSSGMLFSIALWDPRHRLMVSALLFRWLEQPMSKRIVARR